jgi:hypothetical protein
MWVLQKLANVVIFSFWDTCASIAFVGKIQSLFLMPICGYCEVGKTNTYRSQMTSTWFTKHMGNNAYDTQDINIWVTNTYDTQTIIILC